MLLKRRVKEFFIINLPKHILHDEGDGTLIFSESPSLRRPRDQWIKQMFSKSIFFYCPHSPHIYAADLDKKYPELDTVNLEKKYFLLGGHPADYFTVDAESELAAPDLEKVFIGHPKYSDRWLRVRQDEARSFRSSSAERIQTNILVVSRGHGSYIDEESHADLVETTAQVIHNQIPNYNLFVKKHPENSTRIGIILQMITLQYKS